MSNYALYAKSTKLSDQSLRELVSMIVAGRLPIAVMAITVSLVAAVAYPAGAHLELAGLTGLILLLLTVRFTIVSLFLRASREHDLSPLQVKLWEKRYTYVLLLYAGLLGLFNARVSGRGDAAAVLLVTAEVFGFCAGQISRGSPRPRVCALAVLMGALPTSAGMLVAASTAPNHRLAIVYVLIAFLIAIYAISSLETLAFSYRALLAQLESRRQLAGLARLDPLTGLPNRILFSEQLESDLLTAAEVGAELAVHMIDLDGFKAVNDRYGHPVGDALLRSVAERLTAIVRSNDTVVRLGGDEFAVIQTSLVDRSEANLMGRRIVRRLSEPFNVNGSILQIGACDGIAFAPIDGGTSDRLIECADAALYSAKRGGRAGVFEWNEEGPLTVCAA